METRTVRKGEVCEELPGYSLEEERQAVNSLYQQNGSFPSSRARRQEDSTCAYRTALL